jgi:hypothetical protein
VNVPRRGMARYGMRSNEISIFGLEFESEDDLRLEGGVDPPFQTSSLERHLRASVSMAIFRGPHGNSASSIWKQIWIYRPVPDATESHPVKQLSHGVRTSHLTTEFWRKGSGKERDPNKLGTRNCIPKGNTLGCISWFDTSTPSSLCQDACHSRRGWLILVQYFISFFIDWKCIILCRHWLN